jgi:O-antigen/teichoic acid export membrane protein
MSRLTKNILYNLVGQGLLLLLGFVAVRFVFRRLGADSLGIIYFAITLNALLCPVLDMGLSTTTVREVAAHAAKDPSYVRDYLRTASFLYWTAYALVAFAVYLVAPALVEKWIHLQTLTPSVAAHALRILATGALLGLPRSFYTSVIRGAERMEFTNLVDVCTSGLQQAGIIVILWRGGTLFSVVTWLSVCFFFGVLLYLSISAYFFTIPAILPGFSVSVLKRNLKFTSSTALISVFAAIHTQADKAIVSKLLPLGIFGYYSFASSATARGTLATSAVSLAALPSFSHLFESGDRERLLSQYRKLQDLLCFGTVPLFAGIVFASSPLFSYLLDRQAASLLFWPVLFLSVGYFMNTTLNTPYIFSLAVGKPEIVARSALYALFVSLPMAVLLIYTFGLAGAGLSWVFFHLFTYGYAVPRICSECLGISTGTWFWHVSKIFLISGLSYGVAGSVLSFLGVHSVSWLFVAYAAGSVAFLVPAYFLIGDELRSSMGSFVEFRAAGSESRGGLRAGQAAEKTIEPGRVG